MSETRQKITKLVDEIRGCLYKIYDMDDFASIMVEFVNIENYLNQIERVIL